MTTSFHFQFSLLVGSSVKEALGYINVCLEDGLGLVVLSTAKPKPVRTIAGEVTL